MLEIFMSYCQKDKIYADYIDLYFKNKEVTIHRDIRDISTWSSIKEYMNTISDMGYTVLIITDNYLKSFNCMYEVLEVMKDNNYKNRIFPVVAETSIYNTTGRIKYIQYWQDEYKKLKEQLKQLDIVNLGPLPNDLKRAQNIASSIGQFLNLVSDMNNPNISDINLAIENKLKEHGLLRNKETFNTTNIQDQSDIFSSLNISKVDVNTEPTDLEKNEFISDSFKLINDLLSKLCNHTQNENSNIQIRVERIDTRTVIYQFYINGNQIRRLKLFLGNCLGGREDKIGVSCDNFYFGNNNSFNAIFSTKFENGKLHLFSTMSISYCQEVMSVDDVVREIWNSYVLPYLR